MSVLDNFKKIAAIPRDVFYFSDNLQKNKLEVIFYPCYYELYID